MLITSREHAFSSYYTEIFRNEGLNEFAVADIEDVTQRSLSSHDLALVGEMPVNPRQAKLLADWVRQGGNLVAMRPGSYLAQALKLVRREPTLDGGYLLIKTQEGPGRGLVDETIQFHGQADLYAPGNDEVFATLYRDEQNPTDSPALFLRKMGKGQAAIFSYDVARSVVYTRQGNPLWSGTDRDALSPIRSDDLFYGEASTDPEPDWVNLEKVQIPQADEQQRLLANLIQLMNEGKRPLPRFWYFPRNLKAVVVMTGDDHGHGGTVGRFAQFAGESEKNCSLDDWQCIRGTSNVFLGSITPEDAAAATRKGFEIGLHIFTGCDNWPTETTKGSDGQMVTQVSLPRVNDYYSRQLSAFSALYAGLPSPTTNRTDCVPIGDFDTQPQAELAHGIRLDMNYYYWPGKWVRDRPGMFTGSGMPMRFGKKTGDLIDVYQAATQMTDESSQSYPRTVNTLLDNALGPREFFGFFLANMHMDHAVSAPCNQILAAAKSRHVPVITAKQLLRWLDGRNGSEFRDLVWTSPVLQFTISPAQGSDGLVALLPVEHGDLHLSEITLDGSRVENSTSTFAGVTYASFRAQRGSYTARYGAP